jgi:DNA-binding SARP family transcriptional activator
LIKLQAFGDPTLRASDGAPIEGLTRQTKRFALLVYLACSEERASYRRDELIATFWPESTKRSGLNSLRQTLFVIRRELGSDIITGTGTQDVSVNWSRLSSDVDAFYRALARGELETALSLYKDDFLAGFHVSGTTDFGFWAEEQRARLKDLAGRAAKNLARRAEAERSVADAVYWWRKAFALSPYDETTLCRIVSLLATSGNRGAALAEFDRYRRRADRELGVEPSPLTTELVRRIVDGRLSGTPEWLGDRRKADRVGSWSGSRRATDRAAF